MQENCESVKTYCRPSTPNGVRNCTLFATTGVGIIGGACGASFVPEVTFLMGLAITGGSALGGFGLGVLLYCMFQDCLVVKPEAEPIFTPCP